MYKIYNIQIYQHLFVCHIIEGNTYTKELYFCFKSFVTVVNLFFGTDHLPYICQYWSSTCFIIFQYLRPAVCSKMFNCYSVHCNITCLHFFPVKPSFHCLHISIRSTIKVINPVYPAKHDSIAFTVDIFFSLFCHFPAERGCVMVLLT